MVLMLKLIVQLRLSFDFCFTVNLKSERFRKAFLSFYRFIQLMHGWLASLSGSTGPFEAFNNLQVFTVRPLCRKREEWKYGHMLTTELRYAPPIVTKNFLVRSHHVVPELAQNCQKIPSRLSQSSPSVIQSSRLSPTCPQVVSKLSQICINVFPKLP